MQRRFLFAGLLAALILVTAVIVRLSEQPATSGAVSGDSPVDVPEAESTPRLQSAGGVAEFDSPNSSTSEIGGVEAPLGESFDERFVSDALSDSVFPELSLPPDIGMHEQAATFASEGRDSEWSTTMEARILDRISQAGIAASTVQVECRESLCRVYIDHPAGTEVSFTSMDQLSLEGFGFADRGPAAFFGFINRLPVRIIYLSRDAEAVP